MALAATMGKPAAKTYTFKSGGIIETFKGMKAEFEADKLDSTSAETNKLNAYKLAKQPAEGIFVLRVIVPNVRNPIAAGIEIGRASCRERV